MSEIDELERKLAEVKLKDFIDTVSGQLERDKRIEGKCFCTRKIIKNNVKQFSAMKVLSVRLNVDGDEPTEGDYRNMMKYGLDTVRIDCEYVSYRIDAKRGEVNMSINNYSCTNSKSFTVYSHEISVEEYDKIVCGIKNKVFDVDMFAGETMSVFDYYNNDAKKKCGLLGRQAIELLSVDSDILMLMSFHPLLIGDKIIVSDASLNILWDKIKEVNDNIASMRGMEYSYRVINNLTDIRDRYMKLYRRLKDANNK